MQSLKVKNRKLEADAAHETRVIDSEIADQQSNRIRWKTQN